MHLPLADCLHEEMSLYFASSIDFISLAMSTPTEDDEALAAVMGDQDEVNNPDPTNLGDQLALRDAEEDDMIAVSVVCVSSRSSRSRLLVAVLCCGDGCLDDLFILF